MPLIHNNTSLPLQAGKTLFDYADDLALRVPTSCGRTGECHECIVEVRKGFDALEPITQPEKFLRENYRLACQATVIDIQADIEFNILRRQPRILTESIQNPNIQLDPLTVREGDNIVYKDPTSPRHSGESRNPSPLRASVRGRERSERGMPGADAGGRQQAPFAKRKGAPAGDAPHQQDHESSSFPRRREPNKPPSLQRKGARKSEANFAGDAHIVDRYRGRILGIAADIGTTTVAMNLVDLENGDIIYTASFENPQRFGGSDIMHRISYDTGQYPGELQAVLISSINYEIGEMVRTLKIRRRHIVELVAVGNTTMRDILFGIDVEPIGQKPYKSHIETQLLHGKRDTTAINKKAHQLGIRINPNANVYSGPLIASHIGSDVAADLLTIDIDQQEQPVMLIDIGTNTEIIAGNKYQLHAASCPAGPAFEGGNVTYAMPGYNGAVEHVLLPIPEEELKGVPNPSPSRSVRGRERAQRDRRGCPPEPPPEQTGDTTTQPLSSPTKGARAKRAGYARGRGQAPTTSPLRFSVRGRERAKQDSRGCPPEPPPEPNTHSHHHPAPFVPDERGASERSDASGACTHDQSPILKTIGNTTPIGICGSGLIDLLAELRKHNIMNELGNFNDGSDEFTFHHQNKLTISRADISALAQAKAANYCGQNIVLETTNTTPQDYSRLYLAGGFANYIDTQNAIDIGFIPNIPPDRITKIGNAALQGATIMLTNATKRQNIEQLTTQINHIELETNPNFFDHFVEGCQFKP